MKRAAGSSFPSQPIKAYGVEKCTEKIWVIEDCIWYLDDDRGISQTGGGGALFSSIINKANIIELGFLKLSELSATVVELGN